jgi:tetratricopeptide (TPR) repeat protein
MSTSVPHPAADPAAADPASASTTATVPDAATQAILVHVQEGKAALAHGDLDGALRQFELVVERFPQRPEGHNNLGSLYAALGRYDRAEQCFSSVLELLPGNVNVSYNRGVVRIRLQDFDGALADLGAVLSVFPEDADCWNNLGVASFLKGDYAEARGHFRHALELVPNYPNALLNLCDTETAAGRPEGAIAACEDYLLHYGDTEVRRKLLELLADSCRNLLSRACAMAEQVLRESPEDTQTRVQLGQLIQAQENLAASAEPAP